MSIDTATLPAMKRPGLSGDAVSNRFQLPELRWASAAERDGSCRETFPYKQPTRSGWIAGSLFLLLLFLTGDSLQPQVPNGGAEWELQIPVCELRCQK